MSNVFVTVTELIEQLQELEKNGYGDNIVIDHENNDYACTGVHILSSDDKDNFEGEDKVVFRVDTIED